MKKILATLAAVIFLSSCASNDGSRYESSVIGTENVPSGASQTTASAEEDSSSEDTESKTDYQTIEAVITGFDGEKLAFEYESKPYSLAFSAEQFINDNTYNPYVVYKESLSAKVINNKLGKTITGKLRVSRDLTEIKNCDVITPNGSVYEMKAEFLPGTTTEDENYYYTLKRTEGSRCVISNPKYSLEADLNVLPMYMKEIYQDEITPVSFSGYMFKDETFMLYDLATNSEIDLGGNLIYRTGGEDYAVKNCLGFFGTVQSIDGETAEVLLNDSKTVITVPVYFNDGEVREGQQIMALIPEQPSLYNSGEKREYSFALIYTDMDILDIGGAQTGNIAYAIAESIPVHKFKPVLKTEIN